MAKKKKKKEKMSLWRRLALMLAALVILFVMITTAQVICLKYIDPPFTVNTAWEWVKSAAGSQPDRLPSYVWRPLEEISPHLQRAVLAGEDQRFLEHHGFDVTEIQATIQDMIADERVRGASTITMQTARSVFLLPRRTLLRKALEAYYTVLIEMFWSKHRIMEMYLNTVDWGDHIMGAEAASWLYFKRPADRLSRQQAAMLAAILPNPHRWSPVLPQKIVIDRSKRILAAMDRMPIL